MNDSLDINSLSLKEQIAIITEDLPVPIQKFLHSPERDTVSLSLSKKYLLHADQSAAFEQAYLYMLLGINTPDDFIQDLRTANIQPEAIKGLTTDINELVFKKLQKEELHTTEAPKKDNPAIIPIPAKPAIQKSSFTALNPLQAKPVETPKPLPPKQPIPQKPMQVPVQSKPVQTISSNPISRIRSEFPKVRTMAHDMELIKHPELATKPVEALSYIAPPTPFQASAAFSQPTPARSFQTSSIPQTSFSPVNVTVEKAPEVASTPTQQVSPTPPQVSMPPVPIPVATPNPIAPAPLIKEYGSDPYREPV